MYKIAAYLGKHLSKNGSLQVAELRIKHPYSWEIVQNIILSPTYLLQIRIFQIDYVCRKKNVKRIFSQSESKIKMYTHENFRELQDVCENLQNYVGTKILGGAK